MTANLPPDVLGFSVAVGAGLLIGLERERRKGSGATRGAAGVRSFTLAALGGALAQSLDQPVLVAMGAAAVAALVALAYWRSQPADPGLTTELALFITYLIGVLCVLQPVFGAGAAAVVALLLVARERLHRFATDALSEAELHDAVLLAALALVVLPLMPAEPVAWMAGLRPRTLALLVVLILVLQAVGHVAGRLAGARAGLALAGLFAGFVSSTATIASMGARARHDTAARPASEAGAILSTASTWVLALVMLAALAPALAWALAPAAVAGAALAGAFGLWRARAAAAAAAPAADATRGPLRLREAALVALMLTAVALAVGWAQQRFGAVGLLLGSTLSALADAHASIAALGTRHAAGAADTRLALVGVLLAVTANGVSRAVTAYVAGGSLFGTVVSLSLLLSTGGAWLAALASGLGS
jgi:uncharacterized membrane protein (DUF4010 family)